MSRAAKLALLGAFFFVCATAAIFQHLAERHWHATPPGELYAVVWSQLSAFRSEDYASAYQQASMSFQEKFNIVAFTDLARAEYPNLVRATRVEFGAVRFEGRRASLQAYFFLPEGDIVPCLYHLIREDGAWKIDSARVLKRWPANRRLGGTRT